MQFQMDKKESQSEQPNQQEMTPEEVRVALLNEIDEKYWKPKCLRMEEKLRKSYKKTARVKARFQRYLFSNRRHSRRRESRQ